MIFHGCNNICYHSQIEVNGNFNNYARDIKPYTFFFVYIYFILYGGMDIRKYTDI